MESPELLAARQKVNVETNEIGASIQPISDRLDGLAAKLATSMSAEEQAATAASVQADADALATAAEALTALGAAPPQ